MQSNAKNSAESLYSFRLPAFVVLDDITKKWQLLVAKKNLEIGGKKKHYFVEFI